MAHACARFRVLPLPLAQLSLAAVLQCGQSFRWTIFPLPVSSDVTPLQTPSHEYRLCLRDRVICLRQSSEALFYRSIFPDPLLSPGTLDERETETLQWIRDYFQLNVDLVDLYGKWAKKDPVFQRHCSQRFSGIRMLRQDPWENLISYVVSHWCIDNEQTRTPGSYVPLTTTFHGLPRWSKASVNITRLH